MPRTWNREYLTVSKIQFHNALSAKIGIFCPLCVEYSAKFVENSVKNVNNSL
jgi:hypothetical protein